MELAFRLVWVRGWDEWSGLEVWGAAEGFVEPDSELLSHLQLMESLAPVAGMLMCRFITSFTKFVKQLRDLCVKDLAVPELVDQVALRCAFFDNNSGEGRRVLGQELTKLVERDQRSVRVIEDIAFRERSRADKHFVVLHEEREIR